MDYDKERTEQEVEDTAAEETQETSAEVSQATTPPAEQSLVNPEVVQKLQSTAQRYKNIADNLQTEVGTYQEALAQFQSQQRKSLLSEFGDNPTVQDLIKKLEQSELADAKLSTREKRVSVSYTHLTLPTTPYV